MSFLITDAFVQQFTGNVHYLAQQRRARLRRCVLEDQITGEAAYLEQLAPTPARKVIARHSDSPVMNTQHLRRRVAPYDYDWGDLIDQEDKVRLLIDPTSAYGRNAAFAMNRAIDDEIIGAFFATAFTGHSGSTSVTWPNGNAESTPTTPAGTQVAVNDWTYGNGSGNVGLTISKLISAKVALDAAEGDEDDEERYITIQAKQAGNLLATTEFTSADYNSVRQLVDGFNLGKEGQRFMGFEFLHSERLLLNGSSQTRVPAWRRSAMGIGVGKDIWTRISERADKRFSWYVYAAMTLGASRLEEAKLVELICA